MIGVENTENSVSANATRMPKKIVNASSRRYPACTSLSRSEPSSFVDLGARSPSRFSAPMSDWKRGFSSTSLFSVSSSRRASMVEAADGMKAYASAPTSIEPNRNAMRGISIALYLDLDDLFDPEIPDRLHDRGGAEEHVADPLAEEQLHVLGVDERQGDGQERRQRQQHVAGQASVRGVDADLAQDLEPLADDVREVLEDLRQVAARLALD